MAVRSSIVPTVEKTHAEAYVEADQRLPFLQFRLTAERCAQEDHAEDHEIAKGAMSYLRYQPARYERVDGLGRSARRFSGPGTP